MDSRNQLLKIVVIVMGIMIVVGVVVLVYTIVARGSKMVSETTAETAAGTSVPAAPVDPLEAPAGFASSALGLPAGSRVRSMSVEGRRLILVVEVSEAGERVIIVDLETGARLGSIHLEAAP